jgi:hypothetical protein
MKISELIKFMKSVRSQVLGLFLILLTFSACSTSSEDLKNDVLDADGAEDYPCESWDIHGDCTDGGYPDYMSDYDMEVVCDNQDGVYNFDLEYCDYSSAEANSDVFCEEWDQWGWAIYPYDCTLDEYNSDYDMNAICADEGPGAWYDEYEEECYVPYYDADGCDYSGNCYDADGGYDYVREKDLGLDCVEMDYQAWFNFDTGECNLSDDYYNDDDDDDDYYDDDDDDDDDDDYGYDDDDHHYDDGECEESEWEINNYELPDFREDMDEIRRIIDGLTLYGNYDSITVGEFMNRLDDVDSAIPDEVHSSRSCEEVDGWWDDVDNLWDDLDNYEDDLRWNDHDDYEEPEDYWEWDPSQCTWNEHDAKNEIGRMKHDQLKHMENWVNDTLRDYDDVADGGGAEEFLDNIEAEMERFKALLNEDIDGDVTCDFMDELWNGSGDFWDKVQDFDQDYRNVLNLLEFDVPQVERELKALIRQIDQDLLRDEQHGMELDVDYLEGIEIVKKDIDRASKDIIAYVLSTDPSLNSPQDVMGFDIWNAFENLRWRYEDLMFDKGAEEFEFWVEEEIERVMYELEDAVEEGLPSAEEAEILEILEKAKSYLDQGDHDKAMNVVNDAWNIMHDFWEALDMTDRILNGYGHLFDDDVWTDLDDSELFHGRADMPDLFASMVKKELSPRFFEETLLLMEDIAAQRVLDVAANLVKYESETRDRILRDFEDNLNRAAELFEKEMKAGIDDKYRAVVERMGTYVWSERSTRSINDILAAIEATDDEEEIDRLVAELDALVDQDVDMGYQLEEDMVKALDAPLHTWYGPYINAAWGKYINGNPDGTSDPGGDANRAMAVKMFANGLGVGDGVATVTPYADVDLDAWFADPINDLEDEIGDLDQYMDIVGGKFEPGKTITRIEFARLYFAVFEKRFHNAVGECKDVVAEFEDEGLIADADCNLVAALKLAGVMEGDDGKIFNGANGLTRAALAKMFVLSEGLEDEDLTSIGGPTGGVEI